MFLTFTFSKVDTTSIGILLVSIIKFRLNAFIALLITSLVTSILVGMPIGDIASTISGGFGSTSK